MKSSNYLTTREAADLLKLSVPTIQNWAERGQLRSWKTEGGHRRILRSSVMEALQMQQDKTVHEPIQNAISILIVEDDPSLLRLYRHHINSWAFGTTVYVTANGYEGLVLAGEVQPHLLICDLRLPGINGFNVVRGLCAMQRFKTMAMVVISGMPEREIDAHGGLPERVHIMGKPVDFARLQAIALALWEDVMTTASPKSAVLATPAEKLWFDDSEDSKDPDAAVP